MIFRPDTMETLSEKSMPDGTVVRVLAFPSLQGSEDPRLAQDLFFAQQVGMTAKIVEITLANGRCSLEPGALYFMKGNLELASGTGGGLMRAITRSVVSGETLVINQVSGTGVVYLEPTFGHIVLHEIKTEEQAVVTDKGAFLGGTGSISVKASAVRSLAGAIFGGEGLFQTRIEGTGIAIIASPVPEKELVRVKMDGDTLHVDGNFALMRSAGVTFGVERSTKSWIGASMSGEGMLNVYKGKGSVWLASTQGIYDRMARMGLSGMGATGGPGAGAPPAR